MIWSIVSKYFKIHEPFGNASQINGTLLLLLYQIREFTGWMIVIHCGTQGVHSENSQHPLGNAIDYHFQAYEENGNAVPFHTQIGVMEEALKSLQVDDFVGLGIYPNWNNAGFHIDLRGTKARWGAIYEKVFDPNKSENRIIQKYISYEVAKEYAEGKCKIV